MTEALTPTAKVLTPELKTKVERRVAELLDLSAKIWPEHTDAFRDMPTIRYDIKNRVGGIAISGGRDDWTIRLNLILAFENEEDFVFNTVGHEVAHLVCRVVFGKTKQVPVKGQLAVKKIRSHGPEWKGIMVKFGLEPAIYHKYDCSSIEVKKRKGGKRGGPLTPLQITVLFKHLERSFKRMSIDDRSMVAQWAEENVNDNRG